MLFQLIVPPYPGKRSAKLVLIVKDQEESIEGIVKNIAACELIKKAMTDGELTVIDTGSTDRTVDILRKLEKDYEFIKVMTENEKERILHVFSQEMG
jgi:glycosyltransferase involved in cell wall biosynthesis